MPTAASTTRSPSPARGASPAARASSPARAPSAPASAGRRPAGRRPAVRLSAQPPRPGAAAAPAAGTPAAAGPATRVADKRAAEDPRFKRAIEKLDKNAAKLKKHDPAAKKAAEAQLAAQAPPKEKLAGAQAAKVEQMQAAEGKKPEPASFLELLRAEIEKAMPKNLGETDEFMTDEKKREMKSGVSGNISEQKEAATGEIKATTQTPPDTSQIPGKEVKPMPVDALPPASTTPIGAKDAMPAPKTPEEVSLQKSKDDTTKQMADARITTEQLKKANDPNFTAVVKNKESVDRHADSAPKKFRAGEQKTLADAAAKAVAVEQKNMAQMKGAHGRAGANVKSRQQLAKEKDEARRKEVTDTIERIFNETKKTVEDKLATLEMDVNTMFDRGVETAMTNMKNYIDRRKDAWKFDRYFSLGPVIGGARWLADKLMGLPDEVKVFYEEGRKLFTQELDTLIVRIASTVETRLKEAKAEISKGQKKISEYVASLPQDLQAVGKAAEKEMSSRFDELRQGVDDKKNDLAQGLAQKYKEARDKAEESLKAMQEEDKGLVAAFAEKLREVAEALRKFKERVMGMLKKAEDTINLIVADPIGFLKNLLDAIKKGIRQFADNIWEHLKTGFMAWLFGSLAEMGITLPKDFSLPSILQLVLSVLGITWTKIRAKIVKIIGERNMALLEAAVELVKALIDGGPAALWEKMKEYLGNLKEMIVNAIQEWVVSSIIKAAITKLATMFNPVGAIIQAILAIYNTVMFFIERINQILAFVEAIIESVFNIATGKIDAAANWIEKALARTIPIIIGFLARLLGLSGVTEKVKGIILKLQTKVDQAIDKVIDKTVGTVKKLFASGKAVAGKVSGADAERDKKLQAGLAAIDQEEKALKKDENKLEKADAEKVAAKVKQAHPVFKSLVIVDGGDTWDYDYVVNPKGKKKGEKKLDPGQQLKAAKKEFTIRLFTREELEDHLKVSKSTALDRIKNWKAAGVLFERLSTTFDPLTEYSFKESMAGPRETNPNNRSKYGYQNPKKTSELGLKILSLGLNLVTSKPPIKKTEVSFHQNRARYTSVVNPSAYPSFKFSVAILGHKPPGASGHWNEFGHKQEKEKNVAWNHKLSSYHGPEHEDESAASGGKSPRYLTPSKAKKSHKSWWYVK